MANKNHQMASVSDKVEGGAGGDLSSSCKIQHPTEETENYWIYASNSTEKNNRTPGGNGNCGKWLIFEPYDRINYVWTLIKRETEVGELGFSAKVSTMKDKDDDSSFDGENFVICVYTYDHNDETDVMRVRNRLREIGFLRKLPYKTDAATYAGIYSHKNPNPGKRVSKWYC